MRTAAFRDAGLAGEYDFVLPLGSADACSIALGLCGLQRQPSLFDGAGGKSIGEGVRLVGDLVSDMGSCGCVLAVYAAMPGDESPSDAELEQSLSAVRGMFPGVRFDLLLVSCRSGCWEEEWRAVSDGIVEVVSDYCPRGSCPGRVSPPCDLRALAAVFAGIRVREGASAPTVAVRSAALRGGTRRRSALFSRTGAAARAKLALLRVAQSPVLLLLGLFTKRRKFEHFLLLGYNCETAFRFIMANGFLDSTFFAWTNAWRVGMTLDALRHFDELFTGELVLSGVGDLIVDAKTGISMHAREKSVPAPGGSGDCEAVKSELRSRAAYLREKFYRQLRDEESTLAVVKLSTCDCPRGDENARSLVAQLGAMGGRNVRLLVVCQQGDAKFFPDEHPDYDLRTVSCFSPDWMAASELGGDRLGWLRIWREFSPARVIAQRKTYKFQKRRRR